MELTLSYEDEDESGTETISDANRYDSPDFDPTTVELSNARYIEYETAVLVNATGSDLTMVVQHHKGDATRYEHVTEVNRTPESLCIKQSDETNPDYLPPHDSIKWITE